MSDATPHDITRKRVRYDEPPADSVDVRRDLEFPDAGGKPLLMDLYVPRSANRRPLPVVVIVHGYPDEGFARMLGVRFKEMGACESWGRLIAAAGMAAVTYTNRIPAPGLEALLTHLLGHGAESGLDADRMGVFATSGHVPLALAALMQHGSAVFKCAALLYGYTLDLDDATEVADASRTFKFANPAQGRSMSDLPRDVPLLLVRAGQDTTPGLNQSADRFLLRALADDLPVTALNVPDAPHAFDLELDTAAARHAVRQVLRFLEAHLIGSR